ncbi:hypothetical protein LX36DRAFT_450682 [Colletotrichum falcatum]|nr:hypothetical protein LX36DRAFT_450682 [Colletotrichum falcatum]
MIELPRKDGPPPPCPHGFVYSVPYPSPCLGSHEGRVGWSDIVWHGYSTRDSERSFRETCKSPAFRVKWFGCHPGHLSVPYTLFLSNPSTPRPTLCSPFVPPLDISSQGHKPAYPSRNPQKWPSLASLNSSTAVCNRSASFPPRQMVTSRIPNLSPTLQYPFRPIRMNGMPNIGLPGTPKASRQRPEFKRRGL